MNLYIKAAFITVVFLLLRFMHMKYIEKEPLPPQQFVKDAVLSFLSVIGGLFLYTNLYSTTAEHISENTPPIFTEAPNF